MTTAKIISVESLVSNKTGEGRVNIYLQESGAPSYQLSTDEARGLASNLFQAAEAAETDALFLAFGGNKHGPNLVQELRQKRDEWKKNRRGKKIN